MNYYNSECKKQVWKPLGDTGQNRMGHWLRPRRAELCSTG